MGAGASAGAVALLALTAGCTDQDYDLGNLDTEMQIAVNELTVPLNLAPVKFESMVNLLFCGPKVLAVPSGHA